MSIMELGALGEFVGAIAVVVTLVYLAVQVRVSAKSTESNAIAQAASDHLANMRCLAQDRVLAEAFQKSQQGEELDTTEAIQLYWWLACFLRGAETHIQMAKLGVVPEFDEPWQKILGGLSQNSTMLRDLMVSYVGSKTFRDWLDEQLEK